MKPLAALLLLAFLANASADDKPTVPGPTETGFLLPNGWHLTPAGKHVDISDLPLNIHPLKDNKHALVTTNGFNRHDVSLVDLTSGKVVSSEWARQSWFGLAVSANEDKIWWSGGGNGFLHTFDLKDATYTRTSKTTAVCSSCHGTTLAAEHMTQNGAGFALTQLSIDGAQKSPFGPGAETCTLCHGAGQKFDPALFHGH